MTATGGIWTGFAVFIVAMLALDLGVFHRRPRTVSLGESLTWTAIWATLALTFNAAIWHFRGDQAAMEFFAGYLIEKSLSLDNVFVFALLFSSFKVPGALQHKVLFWGIFGALVLRGAMIAIGAELFHSLAWIGYVFGALLLVTGARMVATRTRDSGAERGLFQGWLRTKVPVTADFRGDRFFSRQNGRRIATPLFLVLLLVEISDVIFAVDSIPAVFAVTKDTFIVFSSNVFAILGLRSLYFALAGVMQRFRHLKTGLGIVLAFVGVKMLVAQSPWKISMPVSLAVIAAILAATLLASRLPAGARAVKGGRAEERPAQ